MSDARTVLPLASAATGSATSVDARDQTVAFGPGGRPRAPEGAPNVLVVLIDDMGFGASSAFGGPCEMPTAERLAEGGLRYNRFHTTAICSPTRAALLTGRNHHSVGMGWLAEFGASAPGYNGRRPASAAPIARTLQCNGYATGAFGKWHQVPVGEATPVGPFGYWPTGEGFEKFYGFLGGLTNQWSPPLYDGTTQVDPPRTPEEGYHLSEDLVDQAIQWVSNVHALRPGDPFFCYLAFGATHDPLHVDRGWSDKYRGRFDHGWDRQRELTFARQKELGVIPPETELARWAEGVIPHWDELSHDEQRAACALMEVYAGFAEHTDAQVGRLVDALDELGALDNTLIFYILGDNGAAAEAGIEGSANSVVRYSGGGSETPADVLSQRDVLGGPETWPSYPVGWALAMDTPCQWTKRFASHYGGTRNGLIVHWPERVAGGEIRPQWHHVIDVAPTILEAAALPQPLVVDGAAQMPIEGTAMNYSFADAAAPDRHTTQYFEVEGTRAIYHEGWVACAAHRLRPWEFLERPGPLADDVWELYDTTTDWSQARDVADLHPEKLEQLKELFLIEAARHNVLPIDDRPLFDRVASMSELAAMLPQTRTFRAGVRDFPRQAVPATVNASHSITARVTVPAGGADGVLCAQGGRFGGWSLYCHEGLLTYCQNAEGRALSYLRASTALAPGVHDVRFEFDSDGSGAGAGGTGRLFVDGAMVAEERIDQTARSYFEGFDVGADRLTAVSPETRTLDNAFNGAIEWVRLETQRPPLDEARDEAEIAATTQ